MISSVSDLDLKLIAGDFFYKNKEVPNDSKYLLYYFTTDLEETFLIYYLNFQSLYEKDSFKTFFDNFIDHTGCVCQKRWITKLLRRVRIIQEKLNEAYAESNIMKVTEIKTGKFILNEL